MAGVSDEEMAAAVAALSPQEQAELEAALRGAYTAHTNPPMAKPGPNERGEAARLDEYNHPSRSAVARLTEPIGKAAAALAGLPGAAVRGAKRLGGAVNALEGLDTKPAADIGGEMVHGVVDPQIDQFRQANEAGARGDYVEGVGHFAAGALPFFGPQAAEVGETAGRGDFAGAAGQTAVMAAGTKLPVPEYARKAANNLKARAALRMFKVMRPATDRVAIAEGIAGQVVNGAVGRERAGGLGWGTRTELTERAARRAELSGRAEEALQKIETPVDPSSAAKRLRKEADAAETVPPPRSEMKERIIHDDDGVELAREMEEHITPGVPHTKNPGLVNALRDHADDLEGLAAQYPNGEVPGGVLFKDRAVVGKRIGSGAYETMPGSTRSPNLEADKSYQGAVRELVHDEDKFGPGGLGNSIPKDNAHHVWANAKIDLETSRRKDLAGRSGNKVLNLLQGRITGIMLGGATGMSTGFGPLAGVGGATIGMMLAESAKWGSLRAVIYNDMAKALAARDFSGAEKILQRGALTFAAEKARKDHERNRKAQGALKNQAEGVVTP